ncbi:hypothetical protein [Edaphocola aurantiacus]|uniref:hypothetical protein n=1 Tax=Edaphocola aurantiacus TaxID=2601682 RepID=UPI001C962D7A|nr:hypothetical protein [Edaphocola aurantiacus]
MKQVLSYLYQNKRMVTFSEINAQLGISESELKDIFHLAKIQLGMFVRFHFAGESAVFMGGNRSKIAEFIGL